MNIQSLLLNGMKILNLTDCEHILLFDLITQCICGNGWCESADVFVLPDSKNIDLTEVDLDTLASVEFKLRSLNV